MFAGACAYRHRVICAVHWKAARHKGRDYSPEAVSRCPLTKPAISTVLNWAQILGADHQRQVLAHSKTHLSFRSTAALRYPFKNNPFIFSTFNGCGACRIIRTNWTSPPSTRATGGAIMIEAELSGAGFTSLMTVWSNAGAESVLVTLTVVSPLLSSTMTAATSGFIPAA